MKDHGTICMAAVRDELQPHACLSSSCSFLDFAIVLARGPKGLAPTSTYHVSRIIAHDRCGQAMLSLGAKDERDIKGHAVQSFMKLKLKLGPDGSDIVDLVDCSRGLYAYSPTHC